jgi:alkylresorcinol/alkylpyrone synthase
MNARLENAARPRLLGLRTAVPKHCYTQDFIIQTGHAVLRARNEDFSLFEPVFRNAGIDRRYAVEPYTWYLQGHDWTGRTAAYMRGAEALFEEAATGALAEAGVAASDVGTVVMVSSTGIATPSLDARMLTRLGFDPEVKRVPVFGLGCAGGVSGMSIASRFATAEPDRPVLLVVVELCTLAFRLVEITAKDMVATALFGDGAAAAVVASGNSGGLAMLGPAGEHTWPDTIPMMGWDVDTLGFEVVISRSIPDFATANLKTVANSFLAQRGLTLADIDHTVFHPGGRKVIESLELPLGLPPGSLKRERAILSEYGNMSAPTVLFVMRRAIDEGAKGRGLLSALGPGFSASFMLCEF